MINKARVSTPTCSSCKPHVLLERGERNLCSKFLFKYFDFFFFALISNVTNVPDHRHYRIQMNKSTTLMLKLGLWLEQIWSDFQLWANHWFSTEGQFINFILPEFNFFLFWWRLNFTFSLSKSFHFHTIQSLCILDIQEGRRSPDSDGSIVWGAG